MKSTYQIPLENGIIFKLRKVIKFIRKVFTRSAVTCFYADLSPICS